MTLARRPVSDEPPASDRVGSLEELRFRGLAKSDQVVRIRSARHWNDLQDESATYSPFYDDVLPYFESVVGVLVYLDDRLA